jgi:chromosome partitioning protein
MLIICPFCRKQHNIDEKRIPLNTTVAICKNCHRRFPLKRPAPSPQLVQPEPDAPPDEGVIETATRQGADASYSGPEAPIAAPPPPRFEAPPEPGPRFMPSHAPEGQAPTPFPEVEVTDKDETSSQEQRLAHEAFARIHRQLAARQQGLAEEPTEKVVDLAAKETEKARKIGVMISKGGVGKTTTAVNLAAGLALAGFKTLLIDTDTQGQAAYALGLTPKAGLTELVTGELGPDETVLPARDNLWLLAGGKSLAGIKRLISRKDFGGERTVAEALSPFSAQYDYVVVDSAPGWDPLTVNVLFYVTEILIPVSLEVMSLQGLGEFLRSYQLIAKYNKDITLRYILPTFLDRRVRQPQELYDELAKLYPDLICSPVRYNVKLSEAPSYGMTIFEFAPNSPGAADYRELVRKIADDPALLD